jgi:hypothetical protein
LRITNLLRGTAKKFGHSFGRKGNKDIYKLESFVTFMNNPSQPDLTEDIYQDMRNDCIKNIGFGLRRTRCLRLAKAKHNFNKYLNKNCEPKKQTMSMGGKKKIN